jgi:hypothetical protein
MNNRINSRIYLVKYCGGSYDDYYNVVIFATTKKATATNYVIKFNTILTRWKEYYSQFEGRDEMGFGWIKDEFIDQHYDRWSCLNNIARCYYEEVLIR